MDERSAARIYHRKMRRNKRRSVQQGAPIAGPRQVASRGGSRTESGGERMKRRPTAREANQRLVEFGDSSVLINCALTQCVIAKHQSGHGFHHWNSPRQDAWIVTAACRELGFVVRFRHSFLFS